MMDNIKTLPDPHMGKAFRTGVPLHRLGEREISQMADLRRSLMDGPETYHVCTGDLFDRFAVPNHILLAVYESYSVAACSRPDRQFIILRGNHDASRDANRISSFELLALMLRPFKNITVISDKPAVHAGGLGFIPWHPFKDAEEMAGEFITGAKDVASEFGTEIKVVFTHNDIEAFGDKVENLIPTKTLSQVTDLIVNGHIHTFIEQEFDRDGVHVILTGSMQPYTHAENPLGVLYRTLTLAEFDAMPPEDYRDLNIRLLLSPGQDLPTDVDCLSLTSKRLVLDEEGEQVDIEEFMNLDLGGLLAKRLAGNPLADRIMEKFNADETVS